MRSGFSRAWAATAAFLAITLFAFFPDPPLRAYEALHGAWNATWSAGEVFAAASGIGMLIFLIALLIQLSDTVRFALVPAPIKTNRAEARAVDLFRVGAERRTVGRTGILIYLSMREHRAEIVADAAITEMVREEVWGEAMAALLAHLKEGRCADGMVAAVERVGAVLPHRWME